jgi:hypothetical protein
MPSGLPTGVTLAAGEERVWSDRLWRELTIDLYLLDRVAQNVNTAKAAALARPNDRSMTSARGGKVYSDQGEWADDACAYCHNRTHHSTAGVPLENENNWWYGTGDGKHNPYRCPCLKRYLAEGGGSDNDAATQAALHNCLRWAGSR